MNQPPKEKAKELFDKFYLAFEEDEDEHYIGMIIRISKQCALIAVDELISETYAYFSDRKSYWQQVKKEINNL